MSVLAALQQAQLVGPAGSASKDCILFTEQPQLARWEAIAQLKVVFPRSGVELDSPGRKVTPTETKHAPLVEWPSVPESEGQLYTLIMTDPDMPKDPRHFKGEFLHWIVVNCRKSSKDGDAIASYINPGAPLERPPHPHRYSFFLFPQQKRIEPGKDIKRLVWMMGRGNFRVSDYVRKNSEFIDIVPVAANFMNAEFDMSFFPILATVVTFSWI